MKRIALILGLVILAACHKDTEPVTLSVEFSVSQPTTLDPILCKAQLKGPANLDTAGYVFRWDWEGDNNWDTKYSAVPYLRKSFTEPGDFRVTVEALSENGKVLTSTQLLTVTQGFSAPKANFTVTPVNGNFKTIFTFDASLTTDAEEETRLLTFSWDFDNNQEFEVVQKGNPVVQHSFSEAGTYKVNLLVQDTSKLWGRMQKEISVNLIDTLIVPVLRIIPEFPSDRDTLLIMADSSYYIGNPAMALSYSWKKPGGAWTKISTQPVLTWVFPSNSTYVVRCRVYSDENLYNEKEIEVIVSRANRPPTACITKNMRFGNILTVYEFSAWNSSDPENIPSELKAQWDFEGDGIWDTSEDYDKKVSWVYSTAGVYQATLRITDAGGLKNTTSADIRVSPYTNPTSYIKDSRDEKTYGIVKIGNQWWMGENLKYKGGICYQDRADFCEATGPLYSIPLNYPGEPASMNICPSGWHLPSIDNWNVLLDEVGRETAGTALNYGGTSDFNILLGGYAYYDYNELVQDSIHRVAYFLAKPVDSVLYGLQYKRDEPTVRFRKLKDGYYSIRCVKDE